MVQRRRPPGACRACASRFSGMVRGPLDGAVLAAGLASGVDDSCLERMVDVGRRGLRVTRWHQFLVFISTQLLRPAPLGAPRSACAPAFSDLLLP